MIGQPFLLIAAATLACYAVSNDDSRCAFAIPEVALSARTFSSVPGMNGGLSMDKKIVRSIDPGLFFRFGDCRSVVWIAEDDNDISSTFRSFAGSLALQFSAPF